MLHKFLGRFADALFENKFMGRVADAMFGKTNIDPAPVFAGVDPAAQGEDATVIVDPRTQMRIYPGGKLSPIELTKTLREWPDSIDGKVLTWEGQLVDKLGISLADLNAMTITSADIKNVEPFRVPCTISRPEDMVTDPMIEALKYMHASRGARAESNARLREEERSSLLEQDNGGTW